MTTFHEFAVEAMAHRAEDGIRGISSERNRFALHIATAAFASKELADVTSVDLRDWLREMARKNAADTRGERKLTTNTIKRSFALVSSVFTAAHERDLITHSPCTGVRVKKRADENATREKWAFLSLDEQKALAGCTAIPLADRLTMRFAIATGLRQGEQFSLRLTDLHAGVDDPHVVVRFGSTKDLPPKSGKIRRVPLFGDGLVVAKQWLLQIAAFAPENPLALVFPNAHGRRRGVGKPLGRGPELRNYLALIGVTRRIRWHDLRHTCASNLVSGVLGHQWTLEKIRPLMGHSSITITQRYSHISEEELARTARATSFSHDAMPIVDAVDAAPDTQRDVSAWFDDEAACA